MEKKSSEAEIWQRVTGISGGTGSAPEQAAGVGKEIEAVRARIAALNRFTEGKNLVPEEQETLRCLWGLYGLLTGTEPKLGKSEVLPEKNRAQLLRSLLRSLEKSSGRLWAMGEHATGNIRWEMDLLAKREQQLWQKLLVLLGQPSSRS